MHVTQIWQYPVKSMIGSHGARRPTSRTLGIVGDREWALRDVEHGGIANTRQTPGIMQLAAAFTAPVGM